jgi:hypothetical protein
MKTGKTLVIVGVTGVVGYLAYLYFKNKKSNVSSGNSVSEDNTSEGGGGGFVDSLPNFIQSILPSSTNTGSNTSTTPTDTSTGTSVVTPDPLSTSEQKIADAVIFEIKKDEAVDTVAQMQEATDYIEKRALVEKLSKLKQIEKIIVAGYSYSRTSPEQRELINSVKTSTGGNFTFNSQVKAEIKRIEDILKNQYGLYPDQFGNYKI